jgi:putative membrane protein
MERTPLVPAVLLAVYVLLFLALAVSPVDRAVWLAENLTIAWIPVLLAWLWLRKGVRLSTLSYVLMSVLIYLHTIGGHYTFALVPFDRVTEFFGFQRNHYDRMAHFSVGFYAFPIVELLERFRVMRKRWAAFVFALLAIVSLAAFYELIEWQFAVMADPEAGIAVLGSQGDVWDAQKDMLADTLGALSALLLYALLRTRRHPSA